MTRRAHRLRTALLAVVTSSVAACGRAPDLAQQEGDPRVTFVSADGDTATRVDRDDFRWEQARRDARCTLAEFVRRFRNPPPTQSELDLKVGLDLSPEQTEHVWLRVLAVEGDTAFRGTVNNDPSDTSRYHFGDTVSVSWRRVSDWYAVDRDTLIGGFTIRYARLSLTKAERAQFDSA